MLLVSCSACFGMSVANQGKSQGFESAVSPVLVVIDDDRTAAGLATTVDLGGEV